MGFYGNYFNEGSIKDTNANMKDISFSNSFNDVKNIVDDLNDEELHNICTGTFKNSPFVVHRIVLKYKKDPAAFIDIYSIPGEMEKDEAVVIIACKEKYRGMGFTDIIIKKAIEEISNSGRIKKLYWETTKSNKSSSALAKKYGFKKSYSKNEDITYEMIFESSLYNEVSVNSKLDKEFNSKEHLELDSFKSVRITKTQIDKYKELKHCKSENCEGFIWLDSDKVICYVNVETKDNDEKWIQALEVMKDYQGKGIANQLLYVATSNLGARYLSVNKKNEIAIKIYKDYGFKIYDETDIMYFMKLGR